MAPGTLGNASVQVSLSKHYEGAKCLMNMALLPSFLRYLNCWKVKVDIIKADITKLDTIKVDTIKVDIIKADTIKADTMRLYKIRQTKLR